MMVHFLYHHGTVTVPSWFLFFAVVAGFGGFEVFFYSAVFAAFADGQIRGGGGISVIELPDVLLVRR